MKCFMIGCALAASQAVAQDSYRLDTQVCAAASDAAIAITKTIVRQSHWQQVDHDGLLDSRYSTVMDLHDKSAVSDPRKKIYYNQAVGVLYLKSISMKYAVDLREQTKQYPVSNPLLPVLMGQRVNNWCSQQGQFKLTTLPSRLP